MNEITISGRASQNKANTEESTQKRGKTIFHVVGERRREMRRSKREWNGESACVRQWQHGRVGGKTETGREETRARSRERERDHVSKMVR